jgi:hypothetical protein
MRTVGNSVNSESDPEHAARRWRFPSRDLKQPMVQRMIVNLARRDGDSIVSERIDGDLFFEGGGAQVGVLVTFGLHGEQVTGRIIKVSPLSLDDAPDEGPVIDLELIDEAAHDVESEITLANLPPENDSGSKI